ncbi:DUF6879 family protein [Streptomyces sp. 21So2-11]|uniref:DUF6879 family protein n=1 Tax=Streptomyces sp. 21So2-11 TaxID=3144408 RepID=UPI00321921EE
MHEPIRDAGEAAEVPGGRTGIGALTVLPADERGSFLPLGGYLKAFREDYARPEVSVVDKLECGQVFQEPGFPSWEAVDKGAWRESLALLAEEHPAMGRQFADAEQRGLRLRRVRYVEIPPSDYVLWEMAVLRQRAELGEQIRVVVGESRPGKLAPPPDGFPNWSFSGRTRSLS